MSTLLLGPVPIPLSQAPCSSTSATSTTAAIAIHKTCWPLKGQQAPYRTPSGPLRAQTPLKVEAWMERLATYPDKAFATFLLRGIREGFRIGVPCVHPSSSQTPISYEHESIVQSYLDREVHLGRMARLTPTEAAPLAPLGLQISPFGVIPKRNHPDKWRLIVNLSAPLGLSANDAIDPELSLIAYTSIDDAAHFVQLLGRGCLLAKLDLREAYRAVPVHPADQPKLGVKWKEAVYINRSLPFGLRSAPKLLARWRMGFLHSNGIRCGLHYLDDFLLLGPADTQDCHNALATTLSVCEQVCLPVAPEKTEGPVTTLSFLGIELDTVSLQLRLPQDKQTRTRAALARWMGSGAPLSPRRLGTKRDLLSLIGLLNHVAKVVRPGRAFLRSLINASMTVHSLEHRVHLNSAVRQDIAWWHTFVQIWKGVSVIPHATPSHMITSDASGGWGCWAVYQNLWIQLPWPHHWADVTIAPKELAPIILAVALWGPQWTGSKVCAQCDNMAVVYAVNKKSARDPTLSRLLRLLRLLCAIYDVTLVARHLPGVRNTSTDALSRNNLSMFLSLNPQASPMPTVIPSTLRTLLFNTQSSTNSRTLTMLLQLTLETALRFSLAQPIPPPSADTRVFAANSN